MSKILKKMRMSKYQGLTSLVLASILGIVGMGTLLVSAASQQNISRPQASTSISVPIPEQPNDNSAYSLSPSEPVSLEIPSINVLSEMSKVANNPDGTIEVPSGTDFDKAAWYKYSPTPGENGSSVIVGHLDSEDNGPSVFFNLGKLKADDTVKVKRADGTTAVFKVDGVREYPKDELPTAEVYGATAGSTLKIITCSGEFDPVTKEYANNLVVFASLIDTSQ